MEPAHVEQWEFIGSIPPEINRVEESVHPDEQLVDYRWEDGRIPIVYDEDDNVLHIGPPNQHHDELRKQVGLVEGVGGFGNWMPKEEHLWTYGIPTHAVKELERIYKRRADRWDNDDQWVFEGAVQELTKVPDPPRSYNVFEESLGQRRPILHERDTGIIYLGPPGAYHAQVYAALEMQGHPEMSEGVMYKDVDEGYIMEEGDFGWYGPSPGEEVEQQVRDYLGDEAYELNDGWEFTGASLEPLCPRCSTEMVDAGPEHLCPSCGYRELNIETVMPAGNRMQEGMGQHPLTQRMASDTKFVGHDFDIRERTYDGDRVPWIWEQATDTVHFGPRGAYHRDLSKAADVPYANCGGITYYHEHEGGPPGIITYSVIPEEVQADIENYFGVPPKWDQWIA